MRKKVFRILLAILPAILITASILVALAENDFNIQKTLIDPDDLNKSISKFQPDEFSSNFLTTSNLTINDNKTSISVEVNSPLKVEFTIKDIRINVSDGNNITTISLEEETKINPGESKILTLSGKGIKNSGRIQTSDITIEIEMLGIIVETKQWP